MANMVNNQYNEDTFVSVFEIWGRKSPSYETHYEKEVIKPLCDFSLGTNDASDAKGKILGAGYEALIMAFFIGLYSGNRLPLDPYEKIKDLGQPLQFWGNVDSKKGRKAYPKLKEYIFEALVAKTPDIDWIALEKGRWTINETVALLISTMEEYINYGLSYIHEKMKEDESFFYRNNAFLNIFMELTRPQKKITNENEAPDPLD